MITLDELKSKIDNDLKKQLVSGPILLDRLRFVDEDSRRASPYSDPRFAPFYYYLGKYWKAKNLLEIGFGIGMFSCCFLMSEQRLETLVAFQEKTADRFSPQFGINNVKRLYRGRFEIFYGNIIDKNITSLLNTMYFDLVLVNEQYDYDKLSLHLDIAWERLEDEGIIVMDYIQSHDNAKKAFQNFCRKTNRTPITFSTRYGVGIVQK